MSKDALLKYTLLVSFLASMGLASKLWFGSTRIIPEVAVIESSILSGSLLQLVLSSVLVLSLVLAFFKRFFVYTIPLAVLAFSLLVLDDINRLQSYYYQFMAMLLILAFMHKRTTNQKMFVMYLLMAGIYFHSGLTKWNEHFIQFVFPNMLYAFHYISLESWQAFSFQSLAYSVPLTEMILAAFLLIPKTRKIALVVAILLHLGILYAIGPFGLNWNPIVWLWNTSMIVINSILYLQLKQEQVPLGKLKTLPSFWIVLALFCLLPFLNLLGKWDNYLSFSLYSGTTPNLQLHLDKNSNDMDAPLFYMGQDTFIDLNVWALQDIHTAIYAEEWVFDEISASLCEEIKCKEIVPFQVYKQSVGYVD